MSTLRNLLCLCVAATLLAGCGNIPRPQFLTASYRPAPIVYVVAPEPPPEATRTAPAPVPAAQPGAPTVAVSAAVPERRTPRVIVVETDRHRVPTVGTPLPVGTARPALAPPVAAPPPVAPRVAVPAPGTLPRETGRRVPEPVRTAPQRPASAPAVDDRLSAEDWQKLRHERGRGFDVL